MCVITILHCTQCKFRHEMAEEGLIVTKEWHSQLLRSLDLEMIPFKRCIEATIHALSPSRSNTVEFPRCRKVEAKNLCVKRDICFRCSNRRKIQKLIALRKAFEKISATWTNDERKDVELVQDMRRSIRESPRLITTTKRERVCCTTADLLTTRIDPVNPIVSTWEDCLERQIIQRELTKTREAEKKARLISNEEKGQEEKRKQARLASVQQGLARVNRLRSSPVMEDDTEQVSSIREEQPPTLQIVRILRINLSRAGPGSDMMVSPQDLESMHGANSTQDVPASLDKPSPEMAIAVCSNVPSPKKAMARCHNIDAMSADRVNPLVEDSSISAATGQVIGSTLLRDVFVQREEAHESALLQGVPALRAEAPEFKPLKRAAPTEPRMMRAPIAPRAMREGSLRGVPEQPRQEYSTYRGYPTFRGWRE